MRKSEDNNMNLGIYKCKTVVEKHEDKIRTPSILMIQKLSEE